VCVRCDRFSDRLRSRVILRGVTDFDVLAYKFRIENGIYGDEVGTAAHQSFVTLKNLEHLFDSVVIQLPERRRMWRRGTNGRGGQTDAEDQARITNCSRKTAGPGRRNPVRVADPGRKTLVGWMADPRRDTQMG